MDMITQDVTKQPQRVLPDWFRQPLPEASALEGMKRLLRMRGLSTVCESARCPNLGRCWGRGVATFMILGDVCTRACRFCAVKTGTPSDPDPAEPEHVAQAARHLGLRYVVVTSVTRDDLPDKGAAHFAQTIASLRSRIPGVRVEVLIPDFSGKAEMLEVVMRARPDVLAHNMEMPRRLFPALRPKAGYDRSLRILAEARRMSPEGIVKSGLMVGLGERDDEVEGLMADLYSAGCDLVTIGQYLSPSEGSRHVPVARFVDPGQFERYRQIGTAMGFRHVFSGPLVRSSYIAEESWRICSQTRPGNR